MYVLWLMICLYETNVRFLKMSEGIGSRCIRCYRILWKYGGIGSIV